MKRFSFIVFFCCANFFVFSQQNYYHDINLNRTGLTLKEELASKIISTHTNFLFYDQIWNASKVTDTDPQDNTRVLLIYGWEKGADNNLKNDRTRAKDDNGGTAGNWNREHVYSQSLGTPTLDESGPGADAHHLRPADKDWNSTRSNRKFTAGIGSSGIQNNGGWYPGDEWKGDVARMMMYMYVRYGNRCLPTNIGFGNSAKTPDEMIDLFLEWNAQDPVSEVEKQRNNYHENIMNENAQGNRNPFIDNPILATRIWGGPKAEDLWGIYSGNDTEAPSTPTNLKISNITTFSIDVTWSAATDNVKVTSYDMYVNGNLYANTTDTSIKIKELNSNTVYTFTVLAKDIVDNKSLLSIPIKATTLLDSDPPTIPENISISNQTTTSFVVSWSAATDNTTVTAYELFVNSNRITTVSETTYTVINLTPKTNYNIQVSAKDKVGNTSALSTIIVATTNGNNTVASELFFSEYLEGSSNNKALEIANFTAHDLDLGIYSIKRQQNGGKNGNGWDKNNVLKLFGILPKNEVFVIINGKSSIQKLIDEADMIHPNDNKNNFGAPINFNGNDPVGLFKNDILIDIIGTFNGGDNNFAKDKTLRRKIDVIEPNTNFNITNEWDILDKDSVDNFGIHKTSSLSTKNVKLDAISFSPNPVKDILEIKNKSPHKIKSIIIFTTLGKKIYQHQNSIKKINLKKLPKGMYILKIQIGNQVISTKFIKN
ncbi:T9SS C-terminal target domain-containing protein [Polaribacter sp. WD7]|uniref:endonuclease n=1 Tax=Polaribacter sp. WD7 TaxID=2269061 RepID=UPI000DF1A209|nr:endonuclease [Polaribacter sp. WD7]RCS28250.1 T9SS C-terminal target domain-containing protein [Polaribacter sp. WD7]